MPDATAKLEPTGRIPLATLPEGYVVLRKMTYGEKQRRQSIVSQMHTDLQTDGKGPRKLSFDMEVVDGVMFDFTKCIVEHNLTDHLGRALNFSNRRDLESLDPAIGEEISDLIDNLNKGEDIDTFQSASVASDNQEATSSALD